MPPVPTLITSLTRPDGERGHPSKGDTSHLEQLLLLKGFS